MNTNLYITISSGNDAFQDGNSIAECARILRHLAERIEDLETGGKVMDMNGNECGRWDYITEPDR